MKGRLVHKIINILDEKDFVDFSLFVSNSRNGDRLNQVCIFLKENEYSEVGIMRLLNVSRRTKSNLLDELARSILQFVGSKIEFSIESKLQLAELLIDEMEDSFAQELLEDVVEQAVLYENYDALFRARLKLSKIGASKKFSAAEFQFFTKRHNSLMQLHEWHDLISDFRKIEDIELRNAKIGLLREKSLNHFQNNRLGQRELLAFLMVQAKTEFLLKDSSNWIQAQEAVIAQIKAHPWICDNFEFELAHEMRVLTQLSWFSGNQIAFEKYSAEFDTMVFKSKRAEFERIQNRFPFEFSVAIDRGDRDFGKKAEKDFLALVESGFLIEKESFLSTCFYWLAYLQFANGDLIEARKTIVLSKKISKSKASNKAIWLLGLLEIACAIAANEFDETPRMIKNLQYSLKNISIPGAIEILKITSKVAAFAESNRHSKFDNGSYLKIEASLEKVSKLDISKYFDFQTWFLSLEVGGPMLDLIAKHRTNPSFKKM